MQKSTPFHGTGTILFMDDQESIRKMISQLLIKIGFKVDHCRKWAGAMVAL